MAQMAACRTSKARGLGLAGLGLTYRPLNFPSKAWRIGKCLPCPGPPHAFGAARRPFSVFFDVFRGPFSSPFRVLRVFRGRLGSTWNADLAFPWLAGVN